jgi:hypothetical protein
MTPADIVGILQSKGTIVSERKLRERARRLGACLIMGKTMFLLPAELETILNKTRSPDRP